MGFGDPQQVLSKAWLVLNSSVTEGLPLALAEAGLKGVPIVCTEAGGSREVIQDEGRVLGRTVNPCSPIALAFGQLAVLGLYDGLEKYVDENAEGANLMDYIAQGRSKEIEERILAMRAKRRMLGEQLRASVIQKFSGERYLREHEQMLWIGKFLTESRLPLQPSDGKVVLDISN
jgi:glycosyltransferase involved in cell wall biosynthesis